MAGAMIAMSPCANCWEVFAYDPNRVPTILIDPLTGYPPQTKVADGKLVEQNGKPVLITPSAEAMERAEKRGVCPACVKKFNDALRAAGRAAEIRWTEEDTAATAWQNQQ